MKKTINIFLVISILFVIVNIFCVNKSIAAYQQVMVQDGGGKKATSTSIDPDDYRPTDPTTDDAAELVDKVGIILGAVRNISVIVSVIVLMIIGFKYIMGSVEEKANYKATMFPYIIGCIMAVAGTTIVSFIYNSVH